MPVRAVNLGHVAVREQTRRGEGKRHKPRWATGWVLGVVIVAGGPAAAAPLDALLTALPLQVGAAGAVVAGERLRLDLEVDRDIANDRVDVLNLRGRSDYAGTEVGDYYGRHGRLGVRWGDWLGEFTAWQRQLQDRTDVHHLHSWQAAVQYHFAAASDRAEDSPGRIHWALRGSAWGDSAARLSRRSGAALNVDGLSARFSELRIRRAEDRQLQLDLIASRAAWGWVWSGFVGAGAGRVRNDGVSASADIAGCPYQLDFGAERLVAVPDRSCSDAPILSVPNAVLPYDAQAETTYRARWVQWGGSSRFRLGEWTAALGYQYQRWNRGAIDTLLASRGSAVYRDGHTLLGEVGWEPARGAQLLLRGQYMHRQWLGELPLAYNTLTATRYKHHYGLVSAAVKLAY